MRKIDQETVEASRVHGKEYARKVSALLELARVYSCENYGYDWKDYRRILSQRTRALKAFRVAAQLGKVNMNETFGGRLSWDQKTGRFDYVVGQSSNEEITNLLAQIAGTRRRGWLS